MYGLCKHLHIIAVTRFSCHWGERDSCKTRNPM